MSKIQGTINSHIQLPKSILKEFSFINIEKNDDGYPVKKHYVYRMDMEGNIDKTDIAEANVQYGYYEDCIENYFSKIETALGDVRAAIKSSLKSEQDCFLRIHLPKNTLQTVKQYCVLCYIRSEEFVKSVEKNSAMIDLLANSPANAVVYTYLRHPDIIDRVIKNKNLTFIISKENNFIIPQYGGYSMKRGGLIDVIIVVSPNVAFRLTDDTVRNKGGNLKVDSASKNQVDILNQVAIRSEFKYNRRALYAQTEQDLLKYKDFLLSLKEEK